MDCKEWTFYQSIKSTVQKAKPADKIRLYAEVCKKSFLFYCMIVHHDLIEVLKLEYFRDGPEGKILGYHGVLCQIAQRAFVNHEWPIVMAPRGFTKSLFFSQFYTEWMLINPEKLRIPEGIKVSATGPKSVDELKKVKATIEGSRAFNQIFGDIKTKPWNEDEIQVTTGVNIKAKGADAQHRGWHPGFVILDDIHTTEEARSRDRRKNMLDWLQFDVIPQMTRNDTILSIGTNINRNCALSILADDPDTGQPRAGFTTYNFVAIQHPTERRNLNVLFKEGTALWSFWSMEALAQQRASMKDRAFLSEYMNDPFSDDETIFKPEWISWVDESEVPKDKSERAVICAYDPAYTEKDISDFTGWVTLYVSQRERDFGTIYVYEADEKRLSTGEKIDHIFLLESMHQPEAIGIEEVGAQSLSSSMVYIATKLGRYPNIYPMKAGSKSKLVRANSVSQLVQNGVVKFVRGKYPNFVAQLLSFKGDASEHDDMVDAFVYALKIAQSWHLPATETKTEQPLSRIQASRQFHAKGLIHPITGERMDKWKRA